MFKGRHINKVDNNNTSQVTQTQLASNCFGCFEIRFVDRIDKCFSPNIAAGIDIDRRHGLGLVDDEIAT